MIIDDAEHQNWAAYAFLKEYRHFPGDRVEATSEIFSVPCQRLYVDTVLAELMSLWKGMHNSFRWEYISLGKMVMFWVVRELIAVRCWMVSTSRKQSSPSGTKNWKGCQPVPGHRYVLNKVGGCLICRAWLHAGYNGFLKTCAFARVCELSKQFVRDHASHHPDNWERLPPKNSRSASLVSITPYYITPARWQSPLSPTSRIEAG